jgi:pyruvate kinase
MSQRATKIVATLGPASSEPALLEEMIRAGVNVVRLNFSHGKAQDHIDRATLVREAAKRAGREVAIMADLQGPKIRVGKFAEGKVYLEHGHKFILDAARVELATSTPWAWTTKPCLMKSRPATCCCSMTA